MTLLSELQALVATAEVASTYRDDLLVIPADELTELLGKVVVTDEMVERACRSYSDWHHANGFARPNGDGMDWHINSIRAAIEYALGVTK